MAPERLRYLLVTREPRPYEFINVLIFWEDFFASVITGLSRNYWRGVTE